VLPAFLEAAPEAAFRFFSSVIALQVSTFEHVRVTGGLPRIYQSQGLEYAGNGALKAMARAVVTFLTSAAESEDAKARAAADRLIEAAAAQMTHHQFWNLLLEAGAAHPATLGRLLLPLLDGSDLLGHYTTTAFAAQLIAALSRSLQEAEHPQLEQIIAQAVNPRDPDGAHGQELVDMFLGQLDRDRVQDPIIQARLVELHLQGGPPVAPQPSADATAYGGLISARWGGDEDDTPGTSGDPVSLAAQEVSTDIADASSGAPQDQEAARHRLRTSIPRLYDALQSSGQPLDSPALEPTVTTLTHGAELLARDSEVLPDTDLGQMVLGILLAALPPEATFGGNS
jgi:hypothetical protein